MLVITCMASRRNKQVNNLANSSSLDAVFKLFLGLAANIVLSNNEGPRRLAWPDRKIERPNVNELTVHV